MTLFPLELGAGSLVCVHGVVGSLVVVEVLTRVVCVVLVFENYFVAVEVVPRVVDVCTEAYVVCVVPSAAEDFCKAWSPERP